MNHTKAEDFQKNRCNKNLQKRFHQTKYRNHQPSDPEGSAKSPLPGLSAYMGVAYKNSYYPIPFRYKRKEQTD